MTYEGRDERAAVCLSEHCLLDGTLTQHLRIRTYAVVPLSDESGVIEWVSNTKTLFEVVVGRNERAGLHATEHPTAPLNSFYTKQLCEQKENGADKKREMFENAVAEWTLVLHVFFERQFVDSTRRLYDAKTNFVISSAVNSIVGYVFGIGERHLQNILLDTQTGDVLHVDLGYAFGFASELRIPEIVPFRLTLELIDVMGVLGVDGRFRQTRLDVLEVLRTHHNDIESLLEMSLVSGFLLLKGARGRAPGTKRPKPP